MAEHPAHACKGVPYIYMIKEEVKNDDIQLPDGTKIEGTIRFADTKQPAQGITVQAKDNWQTYRQVTTDSEGKYLIEGLADSGSYTELMIYARSGESQPEFEGQNEIKRQFETGDHLTEIDVSM